MVLLDGHVYQIRSDGNVYHVKDDEKSPFACVTFFNPDTFDDLEKSATPKAFMTFLTPSYHRKTCSMQFALMEHSVM